MVTVSPSRRLYDKSSRITSGVGLLMLALWLLWVLFFRCRHCSPPYEADTTIVHKLQAQTGYQQYQPSWIEDYIYQHATQLGYNTAGPKEAAKGCTIWTDDSSSSNSHHKELYTRLQTYRKDLKQYWQAVDDYSWIQDQNIKDIRKHLHKPNFCQNLRVPSNLFEKASTSSSATSFLSYTNTSGYVEPLLPPMRHPDYCLATTDQERKQFNVLDVTYLVHDFETMCRRLKPHSRTVLLDLGASPKYAKADSPWLQMMQLYQSKFGFHFDHIYAYEINHFDTQTVYDLIPKEFHTALHWINAGASTELGHPFHPWTLLSDFTEDDFIVVKLDIDTPSVEVPLAYQLLQNDRLVGLVDQFYFEHHVQIEEMRYHWSRSWSGSLQDTLELFHLFRKRGVAAHFWV